MRIFDMFRKKATYKKEVAKVVDESGDYVSISCINEDCFDDMVKSIAEVTREQIESGECKQVATNFIDDIDGKSKLIYKITGRKDLDDENILEKILTRSDCHYCLFENMSEFYNRFPDFEDFTNKSEFISSSGLRLGEYARIYGVDIKFERCGNSMLFTERCNYFQFPLRSDRPLLVRGNLFTESNETFVHFSGDGDV